MTKKEKVDFCKIFRYPYKKQNKERVYDDKINGK